MDLGERSTRRRSLPAPAPAPPLEDEDLLQEILLRLPPQPPTLRHASLACKRWRHVLSDPRFLRRFRKHHWKLLGFFYQDGHQAPGFTPMLDPPDRILAVRFAMPENMVVRRVDHRYSRAPFFLGCRHGIALLLDHSRREAVLWDPITGGQRRVAFPRGVGNKGYQSHSESAAVLCSAGDDHRHLHGEGCLSTFKLVMVWQDTARDKTKAFACLYESKSDVWGDIISTACTYKIANVARPSIMVGNTFYWLLSGANILEFDIERQTLAMIEKPAKYAHITSNNISMTFQLLRREDNGLGLAVLSSEPPIIQLWARKPDCYGIVSWVLQKTFQLDEFISRFSGEKKVVVMTGYDEDTNVIFLSSLSHDFMLHLETMQFRYIGRREFMTAKTYYPYTNFYTRVRDVAGGDSGARDVAGGDGGVRDVAGGDGGVRDVAGGDAGAKNMNT